MTSQCGNKQTAHQMTIGVLAVAGDSKMAVTASTVRAIIADQFR